MQIRHRFLGIVIAAVLALSPAGAGAQSEPTGWAPPGSIAEDRLRLEQILGRAPAEGWMIRAPSSLLLGSGAGDQPGAVDAAAEPPSPDCAPCIGFLGAELRAFHLTDLPRSLNEGSLWAGRGTNLFARAAAHLRYGPMDLVLAPELVHQPNEDFQTYPYDRFLEPERSRWANPFHGPPESLDAPLRFGDQPITRLYPGQSSITATTGPVAFGLATESLWWGPGVRNALVMSSNAPGIPHAFLRTAAPLVTPAGDLEGRWIVGTLAESDFFDFDPDNDTRSISAVALTLRTALDPGLTIGVTRAVQAVVEPGSIPLTAAFDFLRSVGRPNATPDSLDVEPGHDQVFSLFGRWVFPDHGFESYAEWARYEQPASIRDFLETPNHTQGFTVGLQWARPAQAEAAFRVNGEITYVEPSTTFRIRPVRGWYTSRAVEHGYTHEGRVIGAAIGSGSSSQWLAMDYVAPAWQLGAYGMRVRWDAQAMQRLVREFRETDASLVVGLRAAWLRGPFRMYADLATETRFNYLYQAELLPGGDHEGVDIRNHSMSITLSYLPGGPAHD